MKRFLFALVALICCAMSHLYAQTDSTRYINGLPVSEDDTAQVFQQDSEPRNKLRAVPPGELPAKVYKELNNRQQYAGWRDSVVYLNINTGLYLVPVKNGNDVKIFGLSEEGKPVTFDEVSRSPQ